MKKTEAIKELDNNKKAEEAEKTKNTKKVSTINEVKNVQDMKKFLEKNFSEISQKIADQKNISLKKLEEQKKKYAAVFDAQIAKASEKMDLIKEAARKKTQLKKFKISVPQTLLPLKLRMILSIPFIYGMIIPGIFLHICIEIFHHVGFRLYNIPLVKRSDYFVIDRHHLSYLNWFEKCNCMYCGYFNGLMGYSREIAGRTERYFCPIKHAKKLAHQHGQYENFVDYLDGKNYRKKRDKIRCFEELKEEKK